MQTAKGIVVRGEGRLTVENDKVTKEERYLPDVGRVRDVQQGPDGLLYIVTDEGDGRLLRVVPKG